MRPESGFVSGPRAVCNDVCGCGQCARVAERQSLFLSLLSFRAVLAADRHVVPHLKLLHHGNECLLLHFHPLLINSIYSLGRICQSRQEQGLLQAIPSQVQEEAR